jgi:hypothetical protein
VPAMAAAALVRMAGGGDVGLLAAATKLPQRVSVVVLSPATLTLALANNGLDAVCEWISVAAASVLSGGIVVFEEPGRPRAAEVEPIGISFDRVSIWSSADGADHDVRVVTFEQPQSPGVPVADVPVADVTVASLTVGELTRAAMTELAASVGLQPAGEWGDWSMTTFPDCWSVTAWRRLV